MLLPLCTDPSSAAHRQSLVKRYRFNKTKHITKTAIPPLLLEYICTHLASDEAQGTLAAIQCLSKLSYNLTTHHIYKGTFFIDSTTAGSFPQSIDVTDEEVISVLRDNFDALPSAPLYRANFHPRFSAAYQTVLLTRFNHVHVYSWPPSDIMDKWQRTISHIQSIVPYEKVFWKDVKKVEVEAYAVSAGSDGSNTFADCLVGSKTLATMLVNGAYDMCIDLPPCVTPNTTCHFAKTVAEVMCPASITYHNVIDQRLPFGNLEAITHRYMFMPGKRGYPLQKDRYSSLCLADVDISFRNKQIAGLVSDLGNALQPRHCQTFARYYHPQAKVTLPAAMSITLIEPFTTLEDHKKATDGWFSALGLPNHTHQEPAEVKELRSKADAFRRRLYIADKSKRIGAKYEASRTPCVVCQVCIITIFKALILQLTVRCQLSTRRRRSHERNAGFCRREYITDTKRRRKYGSPSHTYRGTL